MLFGIDKVVKYHMDVPLYTTTFVWVMNKDKYAAMSPTQKKVIDDHCTTEWAVKVSSPWNKFEAAGRAKMKAAPGHEVYALTPDQVKAWKTATEPLRKQWADAVAKTGEIDEDEAIQVQIGRKEIALYNLGGAYYATDDICTHAYASLADGYLEDGQIECPLHGARFDIKTGKALTATASVALATYPVKVEGDTIMVGVPKAAG